MTPVTIDEGVVVHLKRARAAAIASSVTLVIACGQGVARADGPVPPIYPLPGTCAPGGDPCDPQAVSPGDYARYLTDVPRAAGQYEIDYSNRTYTDNTGATRALLPCTNYDQPLSTDQLGVPASVNQAELDDMGYSSADPEGRGALFVAAAATVALQECLDKVSPGVATLGGGTDSVYANQVTFHPLAATSKQLGLNAPAALPADATPVAAMGHMYQSRSSSGGGAGPDYFDNVNRNSIFRGDAQVSFGYNNDGSNGIMSDFAYDTSQPDQRGRLILLFNAIDVSIGSSTNLYTARAHTREYGGPRTIFPGAGGSSPINSQTTETTGGYTVSLGINAAGKYGGFNAGISKEFGQSYSTVDGFNYVDQNNRNHIYEHDGGYRSIAQNHHNESRSFNEMAAWIYPPGVNQQWVFGLNLSVKKR